MTLYSTLHELLLEVSSYLTLGVEIIGVLLIAYSVIRFVVVCIIKHGLNFKKMDDDSSLNHGLSVALEIMLSAEILKTITFSGLDNLISVVVLVLIRVFMAYMLHWENTHKHL